jgi:hypothetical protein
MIDRHRFLEQRYDLEGPSGVEPLHRSFVCSAPDASTTTNARSVTDCDPDE